MAGISPVRPDGKFKIIRPLIGLEKSEIVKYLGSIKEPYRIDHTNLEPLYFRNIVRNEIIPFLERYNPRLKRSLFNLAEHLREDFQFIYEARAQAAKLIGSVKGGRTAVKIKDIAVQPRAIQKEIMRDLLEKSGGEIKKLSFRHWKEMEGLIRTKGKGKALDLPGGIRVTRTGEEMVFQKLNPKLKTLKS